MKFRTEFKDTMDRARYLSKLIKLLPAEDCEEKYKDVKNYRISCKDRQITVYVDNGEKISMAFSGGPLRPFWDFILDKLIKDVQEEIEENIEILNSVGLSGKGLISVK